MIHNISLLGLTLILFGLSPFFTIFVFKTGIGVLLVALIAHFYERTLKVREKEAAARLAEAQKG